MRTITSNPTYVLSSALLQMRRISLVLCFAVASCTLATAESITENFTATVTSSLNPSGGSGPYAAPVGSQIYGSFTINTSSLALKPYSTSNFAEYSAGQDAISLTVWTSAGAIQVTSSDVNDSFVEIENIPGFNFWEVSPLQGATQNSTLTHGSSTGGIWVSGVNGYVQTVSPSFFPASLSGARSAYGSLASNVNGSLDFMTFTVNSLTPAASAVPEPAAMRLVGLLVLIGGAFQLIARVRNRPRRAH